MAIKVYFIRVGKTLSGTPVDNFDARDLLQLDEKCVGFRIDPVNLSLSEQVTVPVIFLFIE